MTKDITTTPPTPMQQGEIILYQPDETVRLEVRLEDDTVWLTQAQIGELFQKVKSTISFHISNIFKEGELEESVVVRKYRTTTQHGAVAGKIQTHHNRFLIIDDELWHCGASFKDLGRRLFAIDRLAIDKSVILGQL